MAKTMFFGCRPVGKAKSILRFKKKQGEERRIRVLFLQRAGKGYSLLIYKFDE